MPRRKYFTTEEKKEAHRLAALKYAHKTAEKHKIYSAKRYNENKETINARRRELYAARKQVSV